MGGINIWIAGLQTAYSGCNPFVCRLASGSTRWFPTRERRLASWIAYAHAGESRHNGFLIACSSVEMSLEGQSRVIQGIVTGIGFIGAGNILKLSHEREIQGLTTAAGIWMTAAIGVAVGMGALGIAILATLFALIILVFVIRLEFYLENLRRAKEETIILNSSEQRNDNKSD